MEQSHARGRPQFRLQPIYGGYPQQQQQPRAYDAHATYGYDYRYVQTYQYPPYQNYGMVNTYNPTYPQQPEPYVSENEGYVIDGVWYPKVQPFNIPQDSQSRGQRTNGRRTAYSGYHPADPRHGGMPDGYGGVVYGKNPGPPDPYSQPDLPLSDRVKSQLEFYFSAKNLSHDQFLCGLMRPDGYVPLSLLMEFPRMKVHKISPALAVRAANESPHLKVMGIDYPLQEGRPRDYFIRTKHSWWKWVPDVPEEEKIDDGADELLVVDMTEPPQRAPKQSLLVEDTKVDGADTLNSKNSRLPPNDEEDTMRKE